MASTNFIDNQTTIYAAWLNDVNNAVYNGIFVSPSITATNMICNGTASGAGFTNLINNVFASPQAIGNVTPNSGAFTTLRSSGTTSLGGTAASVRQINIVNSELAWIPNSGLNAFLNVSDSNGNNGANYAFNIRGLSSSGTAGVPLNAFGVSATTSTFYGNVVANSFKGTNAASAWVYFFGGVASVSGQVIQSSNVSSVTAISTGNWTINFTTALADANYVAVGSNDGLGSGRNYVTTFGANLAGGQYSTTACSCAVVNSAGAGVDTQFVRAVFFD